MGELEIILRVRSDFRTYYRKLQVMTGHIILAFVCVGRHEVS